ncbi:hypothetical protein BUALT_Bualt03G0084600 [Buddleja alternifolia]|uniref:Wax synthase domain-containing protein n=1 Tax=Buddleja alternifolia TaxID=168488 RepID=A0AAV6XYV7_9LAMI|nr:hypothetical protein BUALT_Bualt03G0084600 [Buddleja alternifolia]
MANVMRYWMEGEIKSFIKVWLSAFLSLCYCYFAGKILTKAAARLAAVLPVVCLFLLLPLQLHSMHLGGTTSFFLAWLANFKLLMFVFHEGPSSNPSISLPRFLALVCLPIKLVENENNQFRKGQKSFFNYAIKALLYALIMKTYDYQHYIYPTIVMVIYCCHVYLCLEIILAVAAATARGLLGVELEPQFDEPYLSTSLQDFWGRRWNLMVTRILRPTVYIPVLEWSTKFVGRKWAPLPAVMSTFVVSGLMHEVIFYHLGRVKPTWEITWFFLLHGACLMVEIVFKKAVNGRWRLPRILGVILTVGFVMATGFWLFLPPLLRCKADERGLAEVAAVGAFVKDVLRAFNLTVISTDKLPRDIVLFLVCLFIYFGLEVLLGVFGIIAQVLLGTEVEPPFDEPYLSTSVQNFWGRRWNRVSSSSLRWVVYNPTICHLSRALDRKWAEKVALVGTFVVSYLMHEIIFYYLGRVRPGLGTTSFFLIQGLCVAIEIELKKKIDARWQLPQIIMGPLVFGFVMCTFMWLAVPELLEYNVDDRLLKEYAALGAFFKDLGLALVQIYSPTAKN